MKREERYAKEDESDTWATICFVMSSEVVLVLGNCSSYVRVGASSVVLKFDSGSVETGLFVSEWEFSIGIEESTGLVSEPSGTKPCWGSGSMYVQEKKVNRKNRNKYKNKFVFEGEMVNVSIGYERKCR